MSRQDEENEARGPSLEALGDGELLALLDRAGLEVPEGLPREVVRRGARLVPELSGRMLDVEAWERDDEGFWAAVHAMHLLGAIGAPEAAPALVELMRLDPGWEFVPLAMPSALGKLGEAAFSPLAGFLRDAGASASLRGRVGASALVRIGGDDPALRPRAAALLVELLEGEDRLAVSFAAARAASVDAPEVIEAIEAAFERGAIDQSVVTREQLRDQRAASRPWRASSAEADLLLFFTPRNLAYLASLADEDDDDESEDGDGQPAATTADRSSPSRRRRSKGKRRRR